MTINFDTMTDEDFADAKALPRKPAGRNSPPSKFAPMLRALMESGGVKTTRKPYSAVKPDGGGASPVEQMERELRRAARQIGGTISVRKTQTDGGNVILSFSVKPVPPEGEDETTDTASTNGEATGVTTATPEPATTAKPQAATQAAPKLKEKAAAR